MVEVNIFLIFIFKNRFSSKYVGVYWNKANKKWHANVRYNRKVHYAGYFEIEEDAAKAVNLKCQELNIPLKNTSVGFLDNEILEKSKEKVSNFLFNWFLFWSYGKIICF